MIATMSKVFTYHHGELSVSYGWAAFVAGLVLAVVAIAVGRDLL